ncbi:leucyl aminopeptidase [Parasulfitobacter algicola]|uniref:Probable cytosol aminopeptidase n=1 Tax=Parasulfitobacter algicola TaxID=2614809 RepID=A0ABX2IUN2_9RHOB|nr:leucyl aminopeptidase [Sulfitobacter algicola]NSX55721.1 leucyl aminopeptidase [Sulfitobacter algicola]
MTQPIQIDFTETNIDRIAEMTGRVVVFVGADGKLGQNARRVNRLTKGALGRFVASDQFADMKAGHGKDLAFPVGLKADALQIIRLERRPTLEDARKAGATIGKSHGKSPLFILAGNWQKVEQIAFGAALRAYEFDDHKTGDEKTFGKVEVMANKADDVAAAAKPLMFVAEGVFFTRDLTMEPANVLTTTEFGDRLAAMKDIGVKVEVLEEPELEKLGMRTLLSVGHGSDSPSKVVVMKWNGGGDEAPLALVGKGVVFDTGGISLKPGAGMEDMTMDMGGAGVVAGVMRAIALRKAKANVVGLVGIVENMPSARATRPGDVVKSMKGDTVEIINTDAEGRLVLADVLWYAQDRFNPSGIVDLATLTGAIVVGLGHHNAGVFSNDDAFCDSFLKAAKLETEGAWRMPLGADYDKQIKSHIADIKNVGGRDAGAVTAAQFLQRFIKDDMPWIHLDIAGVASVKSETAYAPKGATGWGVMALNRLIADKYEQG